jgi:hypothetical protein
VILAEGIHSPEQLDFARVCGATLGQGYHLGPPGALPDPLPEPGRPLRLAGGAGDPFGATPWQRVTNWRRPLRGRRHLAARALEPLLVHAGELGETAMVLGCLVREEDAARAVRRFGWLQDRVAFVGILNAGGAFDGTGVRSGALAPTDPLRGTGTVVTLAPDFAACYVAREVGEGWEWAISYDRETVVECALQLIARMEPLA